MADIIDAWIQIPTPNFSAHPMFASLRRWAKDDNPFEVDREGTLRAMDAAGVARGLLSGWTGPMGALIPNDDVFSHVAAAPDRFRAVISVDLSNPVDAMREVRRGAAEGAVGVRVLPWLWELPPNDRRYYPVYAACVEAGLPFCTQIGHTGPLRRSDVGRLIPYLEDVLLDFPDLVVVGGHVGFPWVNEVTTLLHKFPNFYVDTSAYTLSRLPPDFISLLKADGGRRIFFGSNWPMIDPSKCLGGLAALELDEASRARFLGETARKVFRLDA